MLAICPRDPLANVMHFQELQKVKHRNKRKKKTLNTSRKAIHLAHVHVIRTK